MSKHRTAEEKLHVGKEVKDLHNNKPRLPLRPRGETSLKKGTNASNQYR